MKPMPPVLEPDPRDPPIEPRFGQTYLFETEEQVQRWLKANREEERDPNAAHTAAHTV